MSLKRISRIHLAAHRATKVRACCREVQTLSLIYDLNIILEVIAIWVIFNIEQELNSILPLSMYGTLWSVGVDRVLKPPHVIG